MEKKRVGVGVGVMIIRDGKILLGRRNSDYEKAGSKLDGASTWTMPGGSLEYGESFEETAIREVKEETGLILNSVEVRYLNNDIGSSAHFITIGCFSDDFEGEPQPMEPEVILEWKWFPLDNLPEPLFFPSAKVIENYKANKFYIKKK